MYAKYSFFPPNIEVEYKFIKMLSVLFFPLKNGEGPVKGPS